MTSGRSPVLPRRRPARHPTSWWLERDEHGVTAGSDDGPVARVDVSQREAGAQLVFWMEERLPAELLTRLTRAAFEHSGVSSRRPVSVALPRGEGDVLQEVRRHVTNDSTRVAGATCLVRGRVR